MRYKAQDLLNQALTRAATCHFARVQKLTSPPLWLKRVGGQNTKTAKMTEQPRSLSGPAAAEAVPEVTAVSDATSNEGFLQSIMSSNPYFTAGFGLMGLGAVLAVGRQALVRASSLAYRQLLVDLEITSKDKSYDWFLEWMSRHPARSSRNFSVETNYVEHDNGSITATFDLVPGPGRHLLKYSGAYIMVKRERSGRLMDLRMGSPFETITLTTLYRDRQIFSKMLREAQSRAQTKQQGKTVLYTSYGPEWRPFGLPRRKRSIESVVLADGVKEGLLDDMTSFLKSAQWYTDRGIPYRRGYLLYGPPGSGKTSVIQALAGHLDYNICILNLAEATLTDDRLNHLMNNVPARSLLLLEDVDSAFSNRKQSSDQGYVSGVTFSGLLNALDGVASADERIIFMTTNHPERLDPALIRPGRVDFQALLDNATPAQIHRMFTRFYNDDKLAHAFVEECIQRNKPVSTAQLQGLFVFHKDDPQGAIAAIHNM